MNLSDRYRKIDRILVKIILDLEGYRSYLDSLLGDSKELNEEEKFRKKIKAEKDKFFPEEGSGAAKEERKKNINEIFEKFTSGIDEKIK